MGHLVATLCNDGGSPGCGAYLGPLVSLLRRYRTGFYPCQGTDSSLSVLSKLSGKTKKGLGLLLVLRDVFGRTALPIFIGAL